jgi:hypothetical protein
MEKLNNAELCPFFGGQCVRAKLGRSMHVQKLNLYLNQLLLRCIDHTYMPYQIGIRSVQTINDTNVLNSVNNLLITTALKWITIASDVLVILTKCESFATVVIYFFVD